MNGSVSIRQATPQDAAALLTIYRPYVEATTVSFEISAPTVEEFAARIAKAIAGWQWLVAEVADQAVAYAYASALRDRPAYRWSVEVSAYVHPSHQRQGIAQQLYTTLFEDLANKGFCNAYAAIALPNEASIKLHQSVGFEPVGVFKAVGRKFGRWHDVAWYQRMLRSTPPTD
jgi:L-amino acid N-acyltransferase YncA